MGMGKSEEEERCVSYALTTSKPSSMAASLGAVPLRLLAELGPAEPVSKAAPEVILAEGLESRARSFGCRGRYQAVKRQEVNLLIA